MISISLTHDKPLYHEWLKFIHKIVIIYELEQAKNDSIFSKRIYNHFLLVLSYSISFFDLLFERVI